MNKKCLFNASLFLLSYFFFPFTCISNLIVRHLHIEDDIVEDVVDGTLHGHAELGRVDQHVDKFKHTVHQALKSQHLTCAIHQCNHTFPTCTYCKSILISGNKQTTKILFKYMKIRNKMNIVYLCYSRNV